MIEPTQWYLTRSCDTPPCVDGNVKSCGGGNARSSCGCSIGSGSGRVVERVLESGAGTVGGIAEFIALFIALFIVVFIVLFIAEPIDEPIDEPIALFIELFIAGAATEPPPTPLGNDTPCGNPSAATTSELTGVAPISSGVGLEVSSTSMSFASSALNPRLLAYCG